MPVLEDMFAEGLIEEPEGIEVPEPELEDIPEVAPETIIEAEVPRAYQEEQLKLWTQWKVTKQKAYMAQLLESLQPLLKNYIKQFTEGPIPYNVLLSRANIIARDALKNYDPAKSQLGTFVVHQLKPMYRYVSKYQNIKYAPEYISQQYGRYELALRTLENKLGRHPTHEEVAAHLGVSPDIVQSIEEGIAPATAISTLPEEMGDELVMSENISSKQKDDIAYLREELSGKEKKVFDLLSGWGDKKPQTDVVEVAKKIGVSVQDIYKWRRKWTRRLKNARSW